MVRLRQHALILNSEIYSVCDELRASFSSSGAPTGVCHSNEMHSRKKLNITHFLTQKLQLFFY